MGAWIEIKLCMGRVVYRIVAPLVGAWIEIKSATLRYQKKQVAPLVGAWIEINVTICASGKSRRRSPCGSVD